MKSEQSVMFRGCFSGVVSQRDEFASWQINLAIIDMLWLKKFARTVDGGVEGVI